MPTTTPADSASSAIPRFFAAPASSFFLFGPRGTGKTWWVRRHFPDALRLDLLDAKTFRELSAHPEALRERIAALPAVSAQTTHSAQTTVVIDEVQKLPELLDETHRIIEERRELQFVLTGSSARKLRRAGTNLLGGRALKRAMHPYMAAELGDAFSLEGALAHGLVPVVVASPTPRDALAGYNALYLREEIFQEGLTRNAGAFSRFMEAASFSHGAVLNAANIARECQVGRTTVVSFLDILEDLLLAFLVPVFTRRAKRELAAHPKFYFFDTGVFRANRPAGALDRPEEIEGAALEGLVAQHLRAWCDYTNNGAISNVNNGAIADTNTATGGGHALYYWQTRARVEVDFVVYGESGLFAVEVKNTDKIRPADLTGLHAFGEDYPEAKRFLLYRGTEHLVRDGILCLPCEEFLRALRPGNFPF
ncbi:MAG: AAA family ATPase [Puniceicoccales bacterium]|nr:AAA family ATPase [Puniceicoccales bacterium]